MRDEGGAAPIMLYATWHEMKIMLWTTINHFIRINHSIDDNAAIKKMCNSPTIIVWAENFLHRACTASPTR
jgi:hypothetical protein